MRPRPEIVLKQDDFIKRLKVHADSNIDVVAINVLDLFAAPAAAGVELLNFVGITSDDLPENSDVNIEVSDDVIIAGYPRGFYDIINKYPIVKSGIIASKWGSNYKGSPMFLIDAKLFSGSSGSIVMSKPLNLTVAEDSKIWHYKDKSFVFLGVFSGEPFLQRKPIDLGDVTIIKKDMFDLGAVWYASLIPEIIKTGISI